jgi:2-polyprenyl-6-methoxyphenol hydroxylase-like FAD-dependent oxidoreductase
MATDMKMTEVDVAIAGAGPFGLMLAIELGRRGVRVAVFDSKDTTAFNPQANATQARTMEYYRRLGFADEIRELGLPADARVLDAVLHSPALAFCATAGA